MKQSKSRMNQKGFGAVEGLIIVVVIAVIGVIGWYVFAHKKTAKPTSSTSSKTTSSSAETPVKPVSIDETTSWYLYESPAKEFSLRLPDGWKLDRYMKSAAIYAGEATSIIYAKGTLATITEVNGGRDFSGIAYSLTFQKTADYASPSGTKQAGLTTTGGLTIDKYLETITEDPVALGPPKGTKEFTYRVAKGANTLQVVHDILTGETDQTALIEKSLKTILIP